MMMSICARPPPRATPARVSDRSRRFAMAALASVANVSAARGSSFAGAR